MDREEKKKAAYRLRIASRQSQGLGDTEGLTVLQRRANMEMKVTTNDSKVKRAHGG